MELSVILALDHSFISRVRSFVQLEEDLLCGQGPHDVLLESCLLVNFADRFAFFGVLLLLRGFACVFEEGIDVDDVLEELPFSTRLVVLGSRLVRFNSLLYGQPEG